MYFYVFFIMVEACNFFKKGQRLSNGYIDEYGLSEQIKGQTFLIIVIFSKIYQLMHIDCTFVQMQPWLPRGYDPCTELYFTNYYNLPEVQEAFHANVTGIPYEWIGCRSAQMLSSCLILGRIICTQLHRIFAVTQYMNIGKIHRGPCFLFTVNLSQQA